jgi:enamine deaminase RidA (YjgF/YER057c/UK114 family)
MTTNKIYWEEIGVWAEVASFAPNSKIAEYHIMLHVEPRAELFEGQLSRIYKAEEHLFTELPGAKSVFKRYFLSDSTNQRPLMKAEHDCTTSIIQQPPLDGSKIAAWIYMQKGTEISTIGDKTLTHHNGYCHIWQMGMCDNKGDSAQQTESLLTRYEQSLDSHNATLADNCIRTWFFVRDVDTQYAGMVKARKENFKKEGLTEKTHYISSTGIGGLPADTKALVQMDAYSITGFEPSQQRYLYAHTHLNPTYEYGVTFERGTLMEYGDRKHVFISGTASINNKGEVVHIGNIVKQTERMLENVEKLLEEAGTTFSDVMQIIVYLRDHADYDTVKQMFDSRFPDLPTVITLAPVCRPTWLIEMECIAVSSNDNNNYRDY